MENNEKRMVGGTGYEVKHSMEIGSREILIAENMGADDGQHYMIAEYHDNDIIGAYDRIVYSSDYIKIMERFTEGIERQLSQLRGQIEKADFQAEIISPFECQPHDYSQDLTDKVVVIKAAVLRPEHRRGDNQLVYVTHGSGAKANPRGTSVFCHHLNDGATARYERHQIHGILKDLPLWAKMQLAKVQDERKPATPAQEEMVGSYIITQRIEVGGTVFVMGESRTAPAKFATWQKSAGREGYDLGHYLTDKDTAVRDLNRRADNERENLSADKGKRPKSRNTAR